METCAGYKKKGGGVVGKLKASDIVFIVVTMAMTGISFAVIYLNS